MKTFREFINEETMPFAQTEKGFVGIESPAVRDNINSLIAGVTDCEFITPYIALERVAKVLANFHIFLPKQTFLDSDRGMVTIEINQFGEKVGMTDNGEVVTQASSPYYLYFEYEVDDNGTFEVFSEVVTEDELDEILSDMDEDEEELDEEKDSEEDDEDENEDEKEEKIDEAAGTHLDKPQKGKLASINKLNKEEKSGMPAWYEKEKSKSASLQAATKAKKKEQQKKTDYAIRNMKEEQLDELSKKTLGSYIKKSVEDKAHARSDKTIANYNRDEKKKKEASDVIAKRSKGIDMAVNKLTKEENLDELSKATLGSYVKKASHDVAAKSAAVRGFARDAEAQRKDKKPMDARKSDERADKMFKKSWNRRQYMAKAVDKLTSEAKDSYAAYQRRMGMNPEKAAKKEGEWSKQIKKQEKKAKPKTE